MHKLALVFLAFVALASAGEMFNQKKKFMKFAKMKAMEDCYGKDVTKAYFIKWKKAMAKCSNTEMPEMDLPMFKSPLRLVQAMLGGSMETERNKLAALVQGMGMKNENSNMQPPQVIYIAQEQPAQKAEHGGMEKMMKKFMMKMMLKKMMKDKLSFGDDDDDMDDDDDGPEAFFKSLGNKHERALDDIMEALSSSKLNRKRRDASELYDLGDSLTQKLMMQQQKWQAKLGNYSCVMQEMKMVGEDMTLKIDGITEAIEELGIKDQWFLNKNRKLMRMCYSYSQSLPQEVLDDCFTPEWAKIKHYMSCCSEQKMKLCMMKEIKNKLEDNFKPLEELEEETGMSEKELLPLAHALVSNMYDDM